MSACDVYIFTYPKLYLKPITDNFWRNVIKELKEKTGKNVEKFSIEGNKDEEVVKRLKKSIIENIGDSYLFRIIPVRPVIYEYGNYGELNVLKIKDNLEEVLNSGTDRTDKNFRVDGTFYDGWEQEYGSISPTRRTFCSDGLSEQFDTHFKFKLASGWLLILVYEKNKLKRLFGDHYLFLSDPKEALRAVILVAPGEKYSFVKTNKETLKRMVEKIPYCLEPVKRTTINRYENLPYPGLQSLFLNPS